MAEYKATPEQWETIAEYAKDLNSGPACLLELRARIKQLEDTIASVSEEEQGYETYIAAHERWLPITGYEGYYSISSMGRIRSEDRTIQHQRTGTRFISGKILKTGLNPKGYKMIVLSMKGTRETKMIHNMVAEAFISPRPDGAVVCHGPGGQLDNRVENLYYATQEQNNGPDKHRDGTALIGERNHMTRLTGKDVAAIRLSNAKGVELAALYGVSEQCISDIRNYRSWTYLEALEAAQRPASKVYEISKPLQLTPEQEQQISDLLAPEPRRNHPAKPDSSLVFRVEQVIRSANKIGGFQARAAIREVAAWMTSSPDVHFPPALVFALEQEAER